VSESFQTSLHGHCHCGNLEVVFRTNMRLGEVPLRACSCSYCWRHGAHTTSDPHGYAEVTVREVENLSRYQFGLKTHEFFVCRRCGVYVVAVSEIEGSCYATINANTLEERAQLTGSVKEMSYGDENASGRNARRKANWTPAVVKLMPKERGDAET
jgi:hypothetical protein